LRGATLSRGMHLINSRYARRFNDRYDLTGHVFESRFAASEIRTEAHLLGALRYVSLNPVRAKLCKDPAEWEWSSFRSTAGLARPLAFLAIDDVYALFPGATAREQRDRYARFVRSGIEPTRAPSAGPGIAVSRGS